MTEAEIKAQKKLVNDYLDGEPMTECGEVAEGIWDRLTDKRRLTWADARAIVCGEMGSPEDVGYVIHDNVVEALQARSKRHEA